MEATVDTQLPVRVAHIMGKWIGGGVESVVMNYYRHIDKTKVQFDFICDSDSTNIPYDSIGRLGGNVILIPPYQKQLQYQKALKKILRKNQYQIVHSHINTLSIFPLRAAKRAQIPIRIAHSHSTSNKHEKKRNLLKTVLKPFSKVYATDYMCCSKYAGEWLFGKKAYADNEVFLLNNAIDLDKFKYSKALRSHKRQEMCIRDDTLVIGHVGRFVTQKNHSFLIDIFYHIYQDHPNSLLLLAGQGPLLEEIKNQVANLGLNNHVRFLGQRNDIYELYQVFDVFLLPSLYEGLPVVGIEAQATGNLCYFSDEMTSEAKVLGSTQFISLSESAESWAKHILHNAPYHHKSNAATEVSKHGFNIKEQSKLLESYYSERQAWHV